MPSAQVLSEKKKIVEELTGKLKSQAGVFVNYSGITVNEDTELRVKMREANVDYTVIKNTLMRFAVKNVGLEGLEPILSGTTSLAVSNDDPIAPARIIKEYADKLPDYFEIKGGFMDGKILSVSEVNTLAAIPALPVLYAQLLGTMLAPIATLAAVLKAIAEKGGAPADAELSESIPEEPAPVEAAAEAPAEEPAPVEADKKTALKAKQNAESANNETAAEEPETEAPAPKKTASKAKPKAESQTAEPPEAEEKDKAEAESPAKKPAAKKTASKTIAKADEAEPAEVTPEDSASDTKED